MYRVSNGVLPAVEVTDDEAKEVFVRTDPRLREGTYERGFDVYVAGEFGQRLVTAITHYRPIRGNES